MLMGVIVVFIFVMIVLVLVSCFEFGLDDCQNSVVLMVDEVWVCVNFYNMVEDVCCFDVEVVLDYFWLDGFIVVFVGELIWDFFGWVDGYWFFLVMMESFDCVDFLDVVV